MAQPILPFAHPLFLCQDLGADDWGRIDVLGAFRTIEPEEYPHTQGPFFVVAQLSGGLGELSWYVDVRDAETDELIFSTVPNRLRFDDRTTLIYLTAGLEAVTFPRAGLYLIELYCENTLIADTRLRLTDPSTTGDE